MLTLPIKREWLEMIRSGEKQEEYRSISDYYSSRIKNLISPFTWCANTTAWTEAVVRGAGKEGLPFREVVLRAGYNPTSPAIMISGKITIGSGRPEWGAEPGKEYYILHIEKADPVLNYDMIRSKEHDF